MLLIACPWCGARPELEFAYAGQAHVARGDAAAMSDDDVVQLLYLRDNPKGWHRERWRHTHGCGQFFNALRNTRSDAFAATYKPGDAHPDIPLDGERV